MANQAAMALLRVLQERKNLEPDKELKTGRYSHDYRSKEALFVELQPLFVKHGIMPILRVVEHELLPKGDKDVSARVLIQIDVIHGESGDVVTSAWCGEAADAYDKATTKATTSAVRTWLDNLFMIGGDDAFTHDYEDQRGTKGSTNHQSSAPPPTADEVENRIMNTLMGVGCNIAQAKSYLAYIHDAEGGTCPVGRLVEWDERLGGAAKAGKEKLLAAVIMRLNQNEAAA